MSLTTEYDDDVAAMTSLLNGLDDGHVIDLTDPVEQLSAVSLPARAAHAD